MRSFDFGFYGEGGRDYSFLPGVLRRTLEGFLLPEFDVQGITIPRYRDGPNDEETIKRLAQDYAGYPLIVIHFDADKRDPAQTRHNRFERGFAKLAQITDANRDMLPIIPIRNTEAWLLADFAAFSHICGLKGDAEEFGFPIHAHEVETITDSVLRVDKAFKAANVRKDMESDLLRELAKNIDMLRLQNVSAYRLFMEDMQAFLIEKRFIRKT